MRIVAVILVSVVLSLAASFLFLRPKESAVRRETAYEQVMRTGTLRCGYVLYAPLAAKDPVSGKMSGFMVDIVEDLGQRLGLKVVWAEEVSFGTMFAGLETARYDAICTASWISAGRSRVAEFTTPFLFSYIAPVVRADDHRFDRRLDSVNNPSMTLAVIDGDVTAEIAKTDFPRAKTISTPQTGETLQPFIDVVTKKADMAFEEGPAIQLFSEKNPGKIRLLGSDKPLRLFPWGLAVAKGEHTLQTLLSGGLAEMLYSGSIEQIVKKYQPAPQSYFFLRPSIAKE